MITAPLVLLENILGLGLDPIPIVGVLRHSSKAIYRSALFLRSHLAILTAESAFPFGGLVYGEETVLTLFHKHLKLSKHELGAFITLDYCRNFMADKLFFSCLNDGLLKFTDPNLSGNQPAPSSSCPCA